MNTLALSNPQTLFEFLNQLKKRPVKSLSQNFLIDQNVILKMIDLAGFDKEDVILEIGPGAGAITEALLQKGFSVIAIEKDTQLAQGLEKQFKDQNIKIISGDILECDLSQVCPKDKKIKVISNLPFQITSLILGKLLPYHQQIDTLTFIMQKEVSDRILALPKTKQISSLSIFCKLYAEIKHLFDMSPNCFFPKPKVQSSVIQFCLKKPLIGQDKAFMELVRKGFNQRRKMLSSSLPFPSETVQSNLASLNLPSKSRPEDLSLENWIDLFYSLIKP